jgi:hypothetical protein
MHPWRAMVTEPYIMVALVSSDLNEGTSLATSVMFSCIKQEERSSPGKKICA